MKKYYYASGVRVAMRTGTSNPLWLLGDHLGSTSKVANYNGLSEHSQQLYKPWGEKRYPTGAPTLPTTFRYTVQRSETGLGPAGGEGLYFYNARWYDSQLGRFTQPDTLIPEQQGVQAWDRFAYTSNNPVKYTDPTGHCGNNSTPSEGISLKHHNLLCNLRAEAFKLSELVKSGEITDVEALAILLENSSSNYKNVNNYLTDIGIVVGGLDATKIIPVQIDAQNPNLNQYYVGYYAFDPEITGFKSDLNPENENQVRHFLAGASGSNRGGAIAEARLLQRAEDAPEDYALFEKSFKFVDFLNGKNYGRANGPVRLKTAGDWVRNNLAK